MSNPCDDIDDGIVVRSFQSEVTAAFSIGAATASVAQILTVGVNASSGVLASDATSQTFGILISDSIVAGRTVIDRASATTLVVERPRGFGTAAAFFRNDIAAGMLAGDALRQGVGNLVAVGARLGAVTTHRLLAANLLADQIRAMAVALPVRSQQVAVVARGVGAALQTIRAETLVVRGILAAALTQQALPTVDRVVAGIRAAVARVDALDASQAVTSEAFALDAIYQPSGAGWAALAESWGMSRYDGLPAAHIAVIGGRVMLGGEGGLFVLDGATDDGQLIAASADLGVTDLDSAQKKHLSNAYLAGSIVGTMRAGVGDRDQGAETMWYYNFDPVNAPASITTRAKLGRGHNSYEFRFSLANQSGAAFSVDSLRILFEQMSRKI